MKKDISIIECNNFFKRFKGYMFTKKIDKILCFPNCNSIHTFFMLNNIDVIMTDKDNKVLYTFYNLKPWRIILPKKHVYYTYELPVNTIKIDKGKILNLKSIDWCFFYNSSSILINLLYLHTRSVLDKEPVFIWPKLSPTAKSAIVVSSVSPLRCDIIVL